MYKVFFKDRIVFFTTDFPSVIKKHEGLFYKFGSEEALDAIIKAFFYIESMKEFYIIYPDLDKIWNSFCKSFKLIKAGGGLVRNQADEILIIKRNGIWDLPKGKLEKNEVIETAATREVEEECGITNVKIDKKLIVTYHTYELKGELILKETHWYSMKYFGTEKLKPQLQEDITMAMWIDQDEVSYITGNTYSSIKDVLRSANLLRT